MPKQEFADLCAHLLEQYRFLAASGKAFDNGFEGEAKRLAATIRVLLHDTNSSRSLLAQLKSKDILYYDTCQVFSKGNILHEAGLVQQYVQTDTDVPVKAQYVPKLDRLMAGYPRLALFNEWWDRTVIIRLQPDTLFTRKKLILAVCNKDGGSHIDPDLDNAYFTLTRTKPFNWKIVEHGEERDFPNGPELSSVRQIAYELQLTLDAEFPTLASYLST